MSVIPRADDVILVRLTADPGFSADLDAVLSTPSRRDARVILDFAGVIYINSSNIAKLLRLRKALIQADGHLVLCAVPPRIWNIFEVTGLDKVFRFAANEQEAETM